MDIFSHTVTGIAAGTVVAALYNMENLDNSINLNF
jgi:hypothetical protein|tara:strand:+ start:3508 stop:3612 length:105 start_codon:yes stop_codon:yes gene_type:complete